MIIIEPDKDKSVGWGEKKCLNDNNRVIQIICLKIISELSMHNYI